MRHGNWFLLAVLALLALTACFQLQPREEWMQCDCFWEPNEDGTYTPLDSLTLEEFMALRVYNAKKIVCDGQEIPRTGGGIHIWMWYSHQLLARQRGYDSLAADSLALKWTLAEIRYRRSLGGG